MQRRRGVEYDGEGNVKCCRFCFITQDRAAVIYTDDLVSVFQPLRPAAEYHFLIVPNIHIRNISDLTKQDLQLLKRMRSVAESVLKTNCSSCVEFEYSFHTPLFNSVDHVHLHAMIRQKKGYLNTIKYKTGTWWCRPYDYVYKKVVT